MRLALLTIALAAGVHRSAGAETATTRDDNPRVTPGLVKWHASFADAQVAAKKSGKPVLLLHMMGQLDRQFC